MAFKIIFLLFAAAAFNHGIVAAESEAKCDCGIFKSPTPEATEEVPIGSKSVKFEFKCDSDGKESCSKMCQALAGASREEGPKKLCDIIDHTSDKPFVPLVYYRSCDNKSWTYTGLKPTLEICCKDKKPIPCA